MNHLTHDLHVHSTWSDGKSHPIENLAAAEVARLHTMAMVEHVTRATPWVPLFVDEVAWFQEVSGIDVVSGVEANLLDMDGAIDAPADLDGVDIVLLADHQFPTRYGLHTPLEVRASIDAGIVRPDELAADLVDALLAAATTPRIQIAHLFSVLARTGISEREVAASDLDRLAEGLAQAGVAVEISERWRCPSARVALVLADAGVRLVAGTDSHRSSTVGVFDYVTDVMRAIDATPEDLSHDFEQWRSLWS